MASSSWDRVDCVRPRPDRREPPRPLPSSRPGGWPSIRLLTPSSHRPRRKSRRNATEGSSDKATVVAMGTAPVEVVAPGVAKTMVGVVVAGVIAVVEAVVLVIVPVLMVVGC